jgi:hypothetical protein
VIYIIRPPVIPCMQHNREHIQHELVMPSKERQGRVRKWKLV